MDETILFPSPNWFQVSGMAVSADGWLFYGGPSRTLCVLEPLPSDFDGVISKHNGYRAHTFPGAHAERIICLDVNPAWPEMKSIITGASDGSVKEWNLEKVDKTLQIKSRYNHTVHLSDQEEVVGVGYTTNKFAVTVGAFGRIVKWDLRSNIIKTHNLLLSKFKPTCAACSPHLPFHVAVGTKQGVVLLVDVNDVAKTVYKMRGHDDEILSVSWCPEYEVIMKKFLIESENRKSSANARMEKIRKDAEKEEREHLDESALTKTLPQDSFDEPVVEEDDMFDIYKDHEEDEFGHKKYKPEEILVKVKEEREKPMDYLAECLKLRDEILKKKDEPEPSINSLVDAFDKAHVSDDATVGEGKKLEDDNKPKPESKGSDKHSGHYSQHPQRHLLASIGKTGSLRLWSKTGKLVGSCVIPQNFNKPQNVKVKQPMWATLLWYKPNVLLITDSKGQLLECNPLYTDCKNKLEWRLVDTLHKRGLFCMVSNAPRVQNKTESSSNRGQSKGNLQPTIDVPEDEWCVWTAAQDRTLVCYSMKKRRRINTYNTCGGYVYTLQCCPYDARKIAFSVGDGAIRIWEGDMSDVDENKLAFGHVTTYWQNVQGKVLTVAWHPTKENVLAFGTAESRVGLLDIGGKAEKPAHVLQMGVTGAVYVLSWGARGQLYACGGGGLAIYEPSSGDGEAKVVPMEFEGQTWQLTALKWFPTGLMVGSFAGSVALMSDTTYEVLAVNFLFKKMIHSIEWHPQYTSNSSEESPYKDLIAISAMDKPGNIAILKYGQKEDGTKQLETYKWLEGHKSTVLQLAWNPHIEGQLLSSSQDCTARVWDVESGTCTAVFPVRGGVALGVAWSAFPVRAALTGGADCCVRLWRPEDHPPEVYQECRREPMTRREKRRRKALAEKLERQGQEETKSPENTNDSDGSPYGEGSEAMRMEVSARAYKRFLLPICTREMSTCSTKAVRKLAQKFVNEEEKTTNGEEDTKDYGTTFLKMFGTTNELNELLDIEMAYHLENKDYEAWMMLSIFRGQIDSMIKFADKNDLLCPFLVSISPCVSFKYWKDVIQLYLAQIDRCIAQKQEGKLDEVHRFGGAALRKAALLLAAHDVRGAAHCLVAARLHREAYVLCRARHMDSIAEETLKIWVQDIHYNGSLKMAVLGYVALGDLNKAATTIATFNKDDEDWLSLAVDLAKISGQHTFAGHLEDKKGQIKKVPKNDDVEETLKELPTRLELLMKSNENDGDAESADIEIETKE
ncbi:gem-associated protein 5-like [Epargyreus clarus]|uniref:gem-associated protein 5-like n=1 Tax=Epargyreus clarus TaxID=520877 RepID=UPI003C30A659